MYLIMPSNYCPICFTRYNDPKQAEQCGLRSAPKALHRIGQEVEFISRKVEFVSIGRNLATNKITETPGVGMIIAVRYEPYVMGHVVLYTVKFNNRYLCVRELETDKGKQLIHHDDVDETATMVDSLYQPTHTN